MTVMSQNFSSGKITSYSVRLFRLFLDKAESYWFCMSPGENFSGKLYNLWAWYIDSYTLKQPRLVSCCSCLWTPPSKWHASCQNADMSWKCQAYHVGYTSLECHQHLLGIKQNYRNVLDKVVDSTADWSNWKNFETKRNEMTNYYHGI